MFKVIAYFQVKSYKTNERGECVPPALLEKEIPLSITAENAEDARKQLDSIHERVKACLS